MRFFDSPDCCVRDPKPKNSQRWRIAIAPFNRNSVPALRRSRRFLQIALNAGSLHYHDSVRNSFEDRSGAWLLNREWRTVQTSRLLACTENSTLGTLRSSPQSLLEFFHGSSKLATSCACPSSYQLGQLIQTELILSLS